MTTPKDYQSLWQHTKAALKKRDEKITRLETELETKRVQDRTLVLVSGLIAELESKRIDREHLRQLMDRIKIDLEKIRPWDKPLGHGATKKKEEKA